MQSMSKSRFDEIAHQSLQVLPAFLRLLPQRQSSHLQLDPIVHTQFLGHVDETDDELMHPGLVLLRLVQFVCQLQQFQLQLFHLLLELNHLQHGLSIGAISCIATYSWTHFTKPCASCPSYGSTGSLSVSEIRRHHPAHGLGGDLPWQSLHPYKGIGIPHALPLIFDKRPNPTHLDLIPQLHDLPLILLVHQLQMFVLFLQSMDHVLVVQGRGRGGVLQMLEMLLAILAEAVDALDQDFFL